MNYKLSVPALQPTQFRNVNDDTDAVYCCVTWKLMSKQDIDAHGYAGLAQLFVTLI
jgi:hypothetical protein